MRRAIIYILAILSLLSFAHAALEDDMILYYDFDTNSTTIEDQSSSGLDGTATGGAYYTSSGYSGGAYVFDGSDDHVSISASDILDIDSDKSFSFWFKRSDNDRSVMFSIGGYTVGSREKFLNLGVMETLYSHQPIFEAEFEGSSSARVYSHASNGSIKAGDEWTLLTYVFDYSDQRADIYVNGSEVAYQYQWSATADIIEGDENNNAVGKSVTSGSFPLNGIIDEFIMWNRTLSASEILDYYESGLEVENLLNETQANVVIDDTFNTNLTNPTILNYTDLTVTYLNGTTLNETFNRYILYGNDRYAILYRNDSYTTIASKGNLEVFQTSPTTESSLRSALVSLIS